MAASSDSDTLLAKLGKHRGNSSAQPKERKAT
jgi:hypothetical protein